MANESEWTKYKQARIFKWMTCVFAIFLIILGSMLVYECSKSNDTTTNTGLIVVGSIGITLCTIMLIAMVYVIRKHTYVSLKYFYVVVSLIIFGTTVGTLAIINGVDVPNQSSRANLGWAFGGICVAAGVIATLWSIAAIVFSYDPKLARGYAKWFLVDDKPVGQNANIVKNEEDLQPRDTDYVAPFGMNSINRENRVNRENRNEFVG